MILALILSGIFLMVLFWIFPQIDIQFSNFFYDSELGFTYAEHPVTNFIYESVEIVTTTIVLLLLLNIVGKFLQKRTKIICDTKKIIPYKISFFLILSLALGPGLFVHQGMKENIPRPRPKHIIEFGGEQQFAKPMEIREGIDGKSFPSGHAAAAFFLATFALLFKKSRIQLVLYFGGISFGLIAGIGRVAQGKHFLSDILFSGIFTLLIAHILFCIMFERFSDEN